MPTHRILRGGSFDASYPPLIAIASGDTVVLECLSAGGIEVMPPPGSGYTVPPALEAIVAAKGPGPVALKGAEPGDMLEVRIDRVELGADWGSAVSARWAARFQRISPSGI